MLCSERRLDDASARVEGPPRRYYPATIVAVNGDGTLNLEYDDGAFWDNAPVTVLA